MPAFAMGLSAYLFPRHPHGLTVTVRRFTAGEIDAHGNETGAWSDLALLKGCAFDPGSSSEPRLPGQDRVVVEPTLYAAHDAPVIPQDRIIVEGVEYEVDGVARRWGNPFTGSMVGAVISLRRVDG
jgi:hypothetical protein